MSSETNPLESNSARLPLIAIDGVLGSGKTTVAQRLATELGLQYLDTGAMYRSVGLACAWANIDLSDEAAIIEIATTADIDVRSDADGVQQVRLNGDDVTTEIRTPEAARAASTVATIAGVRAALVAQQRIWGIRHGGGVLEGRDIATVVFPAAPVKIYLTASVEERARRRHSEQSDRTLAEVAADLAWRDEQDSTRAADPLRVADGATVVDTTTMNLDDVVERCVAIALTRLAEADIGLTGGGAGIFSVAGLAAAAVPAAEMRAEASATTAPSGVTPSALAHSAPRHSVLASPSVAPSTTASAIVNGSNQTAIPSSTEALVNPSLAGGDTASELQERNGSVNSGAEDASLSSEPAARTIAQVAQYKATRNEKILWWLARFLVLGFSRLYFRVTFEGLENVPKSGAYLVSPTHRSNVDSFVVLGLTKRRIRFLAKEEMWKLSFVHPLWDALGGIKVERGSTDRESMKLCMAALACGEPLAAYPEGTRREGPVVEGLFDGPAYMALKAGVPIVPMGIGGSALAMGRGDKFPKPKHIHVVIGKPLNSPPSNETGRRHIRALTAELGASLQVLLDEAQQKA
jgi:cytidylate kinase